MGTKTRWGLSLLLACLLVGTLLLAACGSGARQPADQPQAPATEDREPAAGEPAASDEKIVIDYAFFAPGHTFPGVQIEKWAEELNKRTGGRVEVRTYHGGTLLTADNMFDGVLSGVAHAGLGHQVGDPGRFPLLSGTILPVGFPSATVANQAIWDLIHEYEPAELDGFKLLVVTATEPAHFMLTFPAQSLDDLRGRPIRAVGGNAAIVSELGGNAVGMPMPEVPEAMTTGVVEGVLTSREVILDYQLEQVRTVIDYPLSVGTMIGVMDRKFYDSLPADVKQVIDELGKEMSIFAGNYHDTENIEKSMDWATTERGVEVVTLSQADQDRLASISESIIEDWIKDAESRGYPGREFVQRMMELKDQYAD